MKPCVPPLALALCLWFLAGDAGAVEPPVARQARVVFYNWWSSPSEKAALAALVELFKTKHPDVLVTTPLVPGHNATRTLFPIIKGLVATGNAPEAFQMNAGYAAETYLDGGLLGPIDELWQSQGLEKITPALVQDLCKIKGHYYSVPIGVHRVNVIWYNKPLLDRYGIDANTLTTWEKFFKAAELLRSKGVTSPIELGENWTSLLAFQGIMASQGLITYQEWVNGRLSATDDPKIVAAFETFKVYLTYVNPDNATLGWDAALKRVIEGDSAFNLMGDWANGEFRLAGKKFGKDYGAIVVPGTRNMYGSTIDTFLHPRGVSSPEASDQWLKLAASREGQDAFNVLKGSISVRSDADVVRYDPYQRSAIADLKGASVYPSIDSASPAGFELALRSVVGDFVADRNVKKAANAMADVARKMAGKFTRQWSLR